MKAAAKLRAEAERLRVLVFTVSDHEVLTETPHDRGAGEPGAGRRDRGPVVVTPGPATAGHVPRATATRRGRSPRSHLRAPEPRRGIPSVSTESPFRPSGRAHPLRCGAPGTSSISGISVPRAQGHRSSQRGAFLCPQPPGNHIDRPAGCAQSLHAANGWATSG